MIDLYSEQDTLRIRIPYRCSFPKQIRQKNQSVRPRFHIRSLIEKISYGILHMKYIFVQPLKYDSSIIARATQQPLLIMDIITECAHSGIDVRPVENYAGGAAGTNRNDQGTWLGR